MNDRLKQNPGYYCQTNSLITQRLEYHAFNMGVPGSNPGGGTKYFHLFFQFLCLLGFNLIFIIKDIN